MSASAIRRKRCEPCSTMLNRPSSSSSTPTISPRQPARNKGGSARPRRPMRLDHRDPPGPASASRTISAIAFLEDVQRQLRAREQHRPGEREDRHARAAWRPSCEQQRRQAAALGAAPRVFKARRLEHLEEARCAPRPRSIRGRGATISSSCIGGGIAVARRHRAPGDGEARLMVVGIGSEPRLLGRDVDRRRRRDLERGAGAAQSRMLRLLLVERDRARRALRRPCRPRSSPGPARRSPSGLSGSISRICAKIASPPAPRRRSASTSSPIAISGSISARRSCAWPLTGNWPSNWSSTRLHLRLAAILGQVGDRLALEEGIDGRDRLDPGTARR